MAGESYDATVSAGALIVEGETEYESSQFGIVFTSYDLSDNKLSTGELLIGSASFGDLDATEIVGGGRTYLASGD